MTNTLTENERGALLTLCVMAAYADGKKDDRERAEVKRILEGLDDPRLNTVLIYQEALTQPQPIADLVARLASPTSRAMAYEMAVCICDADDVLDWRERQFLEKLRSALGLKLSSAGDFQKQAEAIAALPLCIEQGGEKRPPAVSVLSGAGKGTDIATVNAESDTMILNYSILNSALELLPQPLATMAIVPLQMKMVYRIGAQHGFELDRGHIRDFLATAGVGLTSQVVEGYARKLLGGLIGKFAGGKMGQLGKSVAEQAASSAFSFASTYALGQVAKHYYAGGRKLGNLQLKELFSSSLAEAKALHSRYLPQIHKRMKTIQPSELLSLIQGQ